jgi:hypothetical protein
MPIIPFQLGIRSNPSRHGHEGAARLINCYAEQLGEEGKNPWVVDAIPGFADFSDTSSGAETRAMLEVDGILYVVSGRNFYSVDTAGNSTLIGGIATDGLVTIARNRQTTPEIVIVSDGLWFVYQTSLTQGSDVDLPAPIYVVEMDGYFVYIIADGRAFVSGLNDGLAVDPLAFGKADTAADGLLAGAVRGRDLVLSGKRSTEFHQNVGTSPWPFSRVAAIDFGCYAAGSMQPINVIKGESAFSTVIWAATDRLGAYTGVMMLNGYSPVKISPHWVDRLIAADSAPELIRAYSRTHGGHVFYKISGQDFTVAYNTVTGGWHEEKAYGLTRSRIQTYAYFNSRHILGDYDNGKLYTSAETDYTEAGDYLIATVQPPLMHAYPGQLKINALYLDVVPGVGLVSGEDADDNPVVMIDYSQDGGATFGPQRTASVGAAGDRLTSITQRMFGLMHQNGVTFRFAFSAAVAKRFVGGSINADVIQAR